MAEKQKSSLSFGLRYGYGLGEFGFNFILTFLTYYITPFLTNVVGLPMALAATIVTGTSIIKLIGMPVAGILSEGCKLKGSTFRGWMLIGSVIFSLGGVLFFVKLNASPAVLTVYYLAIFFVYWLGYSLMWTNHRGLMTKVSPNPVDRVAVTAASSQLGTIARVIFASIATIVAGFFAVENGVMGPGTQFQVKPIGWTMVVVVYGIICVLCFIVVSAVTKKHDSTPAEVAGQPKQAAPKMTWNDIKTTFSRPMLIFVLCAIFRVAVLNFMATPLQYYVTFVVGNPGIMQIYMLLVYAISFFGALLVAPLTKKIGKRNVFIYTTLASALCIFALLVVPAQNSTAFIVCMCLFQFFGVFSSTLIPVCMADIGEYNALTKGSKAQGLTFSIAGFALQIAGVLGTAAASFGLVAVGFDPANPVNVAGLKGLFIYGLGGLSAVSAVLFFLYPLTEKFMEDLRAEKAAKAE